MIGCNRAPCRGGHHDRIAHHEIRTIESDGQHFIDLWLDGHEMQRRGPFASHEIAEAMAARLAAACGSLFGKLMEIRHG